MNQQTQVREIKVRSRVEKALHASAELTELEERPTGFETHFFQLEQLTRNFAIVAALVLVTVAVRSSDVPEVQSVFGAIQESAGMQWDESLGKLSFVNSILPQEIQAVWNETEAMTVFSPVDGTVVHAWSVNEPYLLLESSNQAVNAAADGEVLGIAHGVDEERIVRIRHADGSETIYGNLGSLVTEVGQIVKKGEKIGTLIAEHPLAFELRVDGRSVKPTFKADE